MKKVYTMVHREDKVAVECFENFVLRWTALGFEVDSVRFEADDYELTFVPYTEDSDEASRR